MATYAKEGARRCFDYSQDLNWHGNSDEFWNKFKQKNPQYKNIPNRELKAKMDGFWGYCGDVLVETPHGILLDRIGYVANTVFDHPKRMVEWKKQKANQTTVPKKALVTNFTADGDVYRCYFYPIKSHNSGFKGWMFSLSKEHKQRMKEKITKGFKYFNHIRVLEKNSKVIKSYE